MSSKVINIQSNHDNARHKETSESIKLIDTCSLLPIKMNSPPLHYCDPIIMITLYVGIGSLQRSLLQGQPYAGAN